LSSERRLHITDVFRLLFPHHVDHLDAAENDPSAVNALEAEHGPDPALDTPMILLNAIVEVAALPDPDWLQPSP
jgi:hypothetical protein